MERMRGRVIITFRQTAKVGGPPGEVSVIDLKTRKMWDKFVELVNAADKKKRNCDELDAEI